MSPQEEIELPLVPNQSWLNELFHRCQLDPNQTALDFVQHAFRHSFESPEAVSLGLQMFAQQILFQVDRRQNHHRPTPATTAEPLLSFATTQCSQRVPQVLTTGVPQALTTGVPIPSVRAHPGRPKKTNESISTTNATTTTITTTPTSKATSSSVTIDEATRPSGKGAAETLQLPVEKLCIETGRVLERFQTGEEAKQSVTYNSHSHSFYIAVIGKNKSSQPHVYKSFFWRLEGSSHRPGGCPCYYQNLVEKSSVNNHTNYTNNVNALQREPMRDVPVEKLCLETGRVLERFDTAEQAFLASTDAKKPLFGNFKQVLQGRGSYPNHIYKGHFWRIVGSNKLPHTMSLKGRQQYLEENTTTMEKSTPSSTATTKQSPRDETTTTTSKRQSQNLAKKPSVNNFNTPQREPMRDIPVEKLCLETGRVLERFDTAEQAFHASTDAKKPHFANFKKVLEGRGTYFHQIYKGHFWRIVGSNKLPHTISLQGREQDLEDDTTTMEKSTPSSAATKKQSPSDETTTTTTTSKRQSQNLAKKPFVNNFNTPQREPMRDIPVEKLCLETGRVLERFDTAEQAFHASTDAKKPHFANFKQVLEGRGSYPHHIYKGHFWRIVGSNKLPHTISLGGREQDLEDDTSTMEQSTPSSAATKKHSPSDETTTTTSKQGYQSLARKALANNFDTLQIEPQRDTPVEKLCLETGRVLERFDTAEQAFLATTDAKKPLFGCFKQVLLGRGSYPHHIYKGHFWRIVGSNKLPHTISLSKTQQELDEDATKKEKSTPSSARTKKQNPSDETTTTTSKRQYDITLPREAKRDTPVEKLCLATGQVLERFDTAEQAYRAMTDSKKPQFYNFKQVLQGIGSYPHQIYKGHFWRVVGSNKLPPTISSRGKQHCFEDGTTRKEKLTSSSDATKKRSRSPETTTTTSKRRKSD